MGILTFIFGIIVLVVGIAIVAVIIAGVVIGVAIGIVLLMFTAVIKGLEQSYYWYAGEPFEIIWIIGGIIALPIMFQAIKAINKELG